MTGKGIFLAVSVLVTCAADFAGDLGWISANDARGWSFAASITLGVGLAWVIFGGRDAEGRQG